MHRDLFLNLQRKKGQLSASCVDRSQGHLQLSPADLVSLTAAVSSVPGTRVAREESRSNQLSFLKIRQARADAEGRPSLTCCCEVGEVLSSWSPSEWGWPSEFPLEEEGVES